MEGFLGKEKRRFFNYNTQALGRAKRAAGTDAAITLSKRSPFAACPVCLENARVSYILLGKTATAFFQEKEHDL
jgi:hypothetical protein